MTVLWMEAQIDAATLARFGRFDHHRVDVDGRAAVLITYVQPANPRRGLLAVRHGAADRHPVVPGWVQALVDGLEWTAASPPSIRS